MDELIERVGLDRVQLHGSESRALVERYGERAHPRHAQRRSLRRAARRAGHLRPALGRGARRRGAVCALAGRQPTRRRVGLLLAGRLDPGNVGAGGARGAPVRRRVASGVESSAGIKDHERVRRFVAAAKEAA